MTPTEQARETMALLEIEILRHARSTIARPPGGFSSPVAAMSYAADCAVVLQSLREIAHIKETGND